MAERFTDRDVIGAFVLTGVDDDPGFGPVRGAAIDKLADYEDAEEEGRLVRLPCKIGTRLYHAAVLADKVTEYTVDGFEVHEIVNYLILSRYGERKGVPVACLGNSYFFTREEAEAALSRRRDVCRTDRRGCLTAKKRRNAMTNSF